MIVFLTYFFYVSGIMATYDTSQPVIDITKKPVVCEFGRIYTQFENVPKIEVDKYPCECEIMVFQDFYISNKSAIDSKSGELNKLINFRPTIVLMSRPNGYCDWLTILKSPESIKSDTKTLCEFAKKHNIIGYKLGDIYPEGDYDTYSAVLAENLPEFLKNLKCWDGFLVGVSVSPQSPVIKNPCVIPFGAINEFVDFYEIFTFYVNKCEPELYNGCTPLKKVDHGENYQLGMMETTEFLKKSEIDTTKLYYAIEIAPYDSATDITYHSYNEVCILTSVKTWCIQNTQDLYDKGAYAKQESAGLNIRYIELDDTLNTCECTSAFIGFKNVVAGFTGGTRIPCKKFDVQSVPT